MSGKKGKNERSDEEVEEDHTKNVEKFEKEEVRGGGEQQQSEERQPALARRNGVERIECIEVDTNWYIHVNIDRFDNITKNKSSITCVRSYQQ